MPELHRGPSARDRSLSFRKNFGLTRPSTCPFSQHDHPGRPELHLPYSCPAQTLTDWGRLCLALTPLKSQVDPVRLTEADED